MCPPPLRKSAGTKVERLSLTQAEVNCDANGTVYDTDPAVKKSITWKTHFENAAHVGSWIASVFFPSHAGNYGKKCLERTNIRLWWVLLHGQIFTLLLRWLNIRRAWGTFMIVQGSIKDYCTFTWFGLLLNCTKDEYNLTHWLVRNKNGSLSTLVINKLLSESHFLSLLACFLGFTLLRQNVTSPLHFLSVVHFLSLFHL